MKISAAHLKWRLWKPAMVIVWLFVSFAIYGEQYRDDLFGFVKRFLGGGS